MQKKILNIITIYFTLGSDENTSINDFKKNTLLHVFCNTWHLFTILSFIEDFYNDQLLLISYPLMFLLVVSVQSVQYQKKLAQASFLFVFNLFLTVYVFSNYFYTGELLEYYFLLPPIIALIYIDNRKLNIAILIICLLTLYIPNLYFNHYPYSVFNNINPSFLFFSIFIVVSYFKNLNIRNEKILEAKTKELEVLDKFKSQFFTNISHEIRTPLTLINGYTNNLGSVYELSENIEIEEKIKKQIHKITDIVDSVLDLAKMHSSNFSLELKSTNVSGIIRKQFMSFEPLFNKKNIEFLLIDDAIDCFSFIDVVYFEKAINNFLINALKYTDEGKVVIKCDHIKKHMIISILDTGVGIEEKDQKNIFKRFYQVNNDINKSGGSGIGLAFSKEIIELHKGNITLKSELGKGSEFLISLPLEKTLAKVNTTVVNKGVEIEKIKIEKYIITEAEHYTFLIVDDNDDMRGYLKSILSNHHCLEASNGLEALEIISKNSVDFVITDYMMPKLNGYELVHKLSENKSKIPIIVLTAKTDNKTKLDVLKLGIDDYISKPFNEKELLTRINNCLKNYTARKEYNQEFNIDLKNIKNDDFIDKLKKYITENSNITTLNQDTIALDFYMSKSSLYRKIKSKTGLTPNNFIKEIRLQKARRIIQNTPTILLKELSSEVGFSHASYFSKIYEKRFGTKPNIEK